MTAASRNSSKQNANRLRRVILMIVVAILILAVALWVFWPRAMAVDLAPVMRGEIRAWVEEQAVTRVPEVHRITMPIDGRVQPIELVEGDSVERGQVVAQLNTDDLQSALASAEAQVQRIEAQLHEARDVRLEMTALEQINEFLVSLDRTVEAAEAGTRASEASRDFAADQLQRAERAHAAGALTETERDRRRLEAVEADVSYQADVLTLRAVMATREAARIAPRFIHEYIEQRTHRRQVLNQELRQAEEDLKRAQRDLDRAAITSPVDGIVFSRAVVDETAMPAGAVLLEIGRMEALEIEAEVLSEDVVRFRPGDSAQVFGGAVGEMPLSASVARIYPQGFTKVSALGIEQQRVLVVLRFDPGELASLHERGRQLGADYRVRVRVLVDHREEALRIPRTAIFRRADGTWQTFAVRNGRAELASLRIGLMTPYQAEVLEGLSDTDRIILSPPADLEPGMRVRSAD